MKEKLGASRVPPEEQLIVEVFVRDLTRSKRFYLDLGFTLVRETAGFAELGWDRSRLYLDERTEGLPWPRVPQANVRVLVPDVDAQWARIKASAAVVLVPIADREYGLRDFTILDPDGFGVRFASRLPVPAPGRPGVSAPTLPRDRRARSPRPGRS